MSSENSTLVKLNNAGFKQNDKWLVEGVSLTVEKGKIVTLIGPNGSGKSTTAKIALGIYKNIEGSVEKYTNKVGYVPQKISGQHFEAFLRAKVSLQIRVEKHIHQLLNQV